MLERERPRQQALGGEVDVDRVGRGPPNAHAVVDAVGQIGASAAHHADLVTRGGKLARQRADMPTQTADDKRRVLP